MFSYKIWNVTFGDQLFPTAVNPFVRIRCSTCVISCDPCYPTAGEVCYCLLLALTTPTLSHPTSSQPSLSYSTPRRNESFWSGKLSIPRSSAHNFVREEKGAELAAWSSLPSCPTVSDVSEQTNKKLPLKVPCFPRWSLRNHFTNSVNAKMIP